MDKLGNRFVIGEPAGSGGFGTVYKGYDLRLERKVAIKKTVSVGDDEARILKQLDHKGLPRLYDIITGGEYTYLVMEWIDGTDLENYIVKNGAMSEDRAVHVGMELLDILVYLHSRSPQVVYQDLKPSNIMLMPNGHIKLVDFGTALIMDYGDEGYRLAGTVGYGAPEQRGITGERHANVRSDIYAWGAVMYSLLSGRMLNKPPYTMEKIRKVCPRLSFGMCHVISRAASRNEHDRYVSARAVKEAVKTGGIRDILYKTGFAVMLAVCFAPLIWAWKRMYTGGGFGTLESLLGAVGRMLASIIKGGDGVIGGPGHGGFKDVFKAVSYENTFCRDTGIFMICAAWCVWGLKLIQVRKFIKVNRSVYLSSRRFPGLWIGALVAGIIFGTGIGGSIGAGVSYAQNMQDVMGVPGIQSEPDGQLPVTFIDNAGNRMLLDYDAAYASDEDMRIELRKDIYSRGGYVTVSYVSPDGTAMERKIWLSSNKQ